MTVKVAAATPIPPPRYELRKRVSGFVPGMALFIVARDVASAKRGSPSSKPSATADVMKAPTLNTLMCV